MCGEHVVSEHLHGHVQGSSPHVRGARLTLSTQPPATGIIPACAGSTPLLARIRPIQQGSSPHVRGAPVYVSWASSSSGIIPACAGSTRASAPMVCAPWDHPRMCGEHQVRDTLYGTTQGSSPHVRGAHGARGRARSDRGIIPACAGSTSSSDKARRSVGDHPRMCGEHPNVS